MIENKILVKALNDKDSVADIFCIRNKQLLSDRNGKEYLSFHIYDKSGELNARMWENVSAFKEKFQDGDFAKVVGRVQTFQGRKQLVVREIFVVDNELVNPEDYISCSEKSSENMLTDLLNIVDGLSNPSIKMLLKNTLTHPEYNKLLLKAPAAKSIHHAYRGGLLEHILSICKTLLFLSDHYTFLDKNLLIFGGIYHDLGKIKELSIDKGIDYTDEGRLVGHMAIACEILDNEASKISDFPPQLKTICKHIILSHHGRLEYGSPKRPKFLEALVVSQIDELDSRVQSIFSFMSSERDAGADVSWTRLNPQYERYFYLGTLPEAKEK